MPWPRRATPAARWTPVLVFTCVTWAFIDLIMELLLHVPFPAWELMDWLAPTLAS